MPAGRKYIASVLSILFLGLSVFAQKNIVSKKVETVVIDAGHGGKDPGAIGKTSKEKDITLAIALKTGELIKNQNPGVKVIYTREDDRFIELFQRANVANKAHADLFISIHANSNNKKDVHGTEFWVLGLHRADDNLEVAKKENSVVDLEGNVEGNYGFDPNSPEGNIIMTMKQSLYLDKSIQFAKSLEKNYTFESNQINRGTKQAGFLVLYKTAMPSILVEVGFVSNADEEAFISSEEGQSEISMKIASAFADYKMKYEMSSGQFTSSNNLKKPTESANQSISKEDKKLESPKIVEIEDEYVSWKDALPAQEKAAVKPLTPVRKIVKIDGERIETTEDIKPTIPSSPSSTISNSINKENTIKSSSLDAKKDKKIIVLEDALYTESNPSASSSKPMNSKPLTRSENSITQPSKTKSSSLSSSNQSYTLDDSKASKSTKDESTSKKITVVIPLEMQGQDEKRKTQKKQDPTEENSNSKQTEYYRANKLGEASNQSGSAPSFKNDEELKNQILQNALQEIEEKNSVAEKGIPKESSLSELHKQAKTIQTKKTNPLLNSDQIVLKIQIKASHNSLSNNDHLFTLFPDLEETLDQGLYKYVIGYYTSQEEARRRLSEVKAKGVKDAFVVRFKNGVRL